MSKWIEIRNDNFDEFERCITIDAWLTNNGEEQGKIIAKVFEDLNKGIIYLDKDAEEDKEVQIAINEAIEKIKVY